jgi:hypothetical protein
LTKVLNPTLIIIIITIIIIFFVFFMFVLMFVLFTLLCYLCLHVVFFLLLATWQVTQYVNRQELNWMELKWIITYAMPLRRDRSLKHFCRRPVRNIRQKTLTISCITKLLSSKFSYLKCSDCNSQFYSTHPYTMAQK